MCTGIRLTAKDGAVVAARTLEFAQNLASELLIIPRNYQFMGTAPSGKPEGLSWKSRYGVVGANALRMVALVDGMNEGGLAAGLFYFPDYADYQTVTPHEMDRSLAPWELVTWILTNYATVAEVRDALPTVKVGNSVFAAWDFIPPIHAVVHDPSGASLVIEYVAGNLTLHENPLGVMTNSPTFDWHMTNLRNYTMLSVFNAPRVPLHGLDLKPFGQGSGMLGLPGDFTSPSRFIRAVALSQGLVDLTDADAARDAAFHLLNNFDIPCGAVCSDENGQVVCEYTQWTSLADLAQHRYYLRSYENPVPQMIDLTRIDFTAKEPCFVALQKQASCADLTPVA